MTPQEQKAMETLSKLMSGLEIVTEQAIEELPQSLELNGPQGTLALLQIIQFAGNVGVQFQTMLANAQNKGQGEMK